MKKVTLQNTDESGELIQAVFVPEKGMNLISFKKSDIEVIDQKTQPLFDTRCAGFGALIGPHFHHRKHLDKEPFSHGIARYVPWNFAASSTQIKAMLSSDQIYEGKSLEEIEGFGFEMTYEARLLSHGLCIKYQISATQPSVIGLHYYYTLPPDGGQIHGEVKNEYRDNTGWKPLPKKWMGAKETMLQFPLPQEADFGFTPLPDTHDHRIIYDTQDFSLHIDYLTGSNQEISCQIYQPPKSSFVCIEPIAALNPREPIINDHVLEVKLDIFKKIH